MNKTKSPGTRPPKLLRRYTDLTATIDMLARRQLTLLDPASWDDRNDSYFLQYYKEQSERRAVLALCLSTVGETYHHWRVFGGHASAVCIEFLRAPLLDAIGSAPGIRHGPVQYMTLEEIAQSPPALARLPFVKRWAFRHELEYRLIYESAEADASTHSVQIPLEVIHGITLSPWMPPPLLNATRGLLWSIPGCEDVRISRSELIGNKLWMQNAQRALRGEPMIEGINPGTGQEREGCVASREHVGIATDH